MLNDFILHGEVVACESRYAIVRKHMLFQAGGGTASSLYAYAIGCFMCGSMSWFPDDVNGHYCGNCKMFHDNP